MSFEQSLKRLEDIVSSLEKGDAELENSLNLFEEGITLVKSCTSQLDAASQRVKMLVGESEEDFKPIGE